MSSAVQSQHRHISDFISANRYFTKEQLANSPSRKDGVDEAKEAAHRRTCYQFLKRLTGELKLNSWVQECAVLYVERFFARRSYQNNDRYLVCTAALFLAAKAQDAPRPIKHVAIAYVRVKHANKPEELAALAADTDKRLQELGLVDAIHTAERAILYTLGFDILEYQVRNPLRDYLAAMGVFVLKVKRSSDIPANELPEPQQQKLSQLAASFVQAIFKTQLPLQYPPSKVAVAISRLAASKMDLQLLEPSKSVLTELSNAHLGNSFVITDSEYEDMAEQVLAQYQEAPATGQTQQQGQQQQQALAAQTPSSQPPRQPAQTPSHHLPSATTQQQQVHAQNSRPGPPHPAPLTRPPPPTFASASGSRGPLPPPPSYSHPSRPLLRPPPPKFAPTNTPAQPAQAPTTAPPPDVDSPPEQVPGLVRNDDHNNNNASAVPSESPEEGELPPNPGAEVLMQAPAVHAANGVPNGVHVAAPVMGGEQLQSYGAVPEAAVDAAPAPVVAGAMPPAGTLQRKRSAESLDGQELGGQVQRDTKLLRVS